MAETAMKPSTPTIVSRKPAGARGGGAIAQTSAPGLLRRRARLGNLRRTPGAAPGCRRRDCRGRGQRIRRAVVPGGRAPEYLRNDPDVLELVRDFAAQGKCICAVGHGIQVLAAVGLTKGRTVTCHANVRIEVERSGASSAPSRRFAMVISSPPNPGAPTRVLPRDLHRSGIAAVAHAVLRAGSSVVSTCLRPGEPNKSQECRPCTQDCARHGGNRVAA